MVEDEYGKTCSMLLSDAKRGLLGTLDERSLASEHIDRRARTRGAECQDESLFLWLEDESDESRLYPFGSVPRPTWDESVGDVEWSADLTKAEFLGDEDRDAEIGRIAG